MARRSSMGRTWKSSPTAGEGRAGAGEPDEVEHSAKDGASTKGRPTKR